MPIITLPDGSQKTFETSVTPLMVAESIGAGLAKATVAGKVNQETLIDVQTAINDDATLQLITTNDPEGLSILRHSCAHLLAQAVKSLYPDAKVAIGPVIDDGFYYDFDHQPAFAEDDLPEIEGKMHELAKAGQAVKKMVMSRQQAIDLFERLGESYKVELIQQLDPEHQTVTCYQQGDFIDLCRGPHVPNTQMIKAFKLTRVAGAYWRGDANNPMLQRIYGTCWADKKSLKAYLQRLEEAEKRDHRKLGRQLDLFHFQPEAPGIAFWHGQGSALWRVVEDYIRDSNQRYGCQEIRTPLIADFSLWEKSGHADKYADNMFMTHSENRDYAIRPMNCPTCVQVYNQSLYSYRDLPVRMAEFGIVHRNEASGALHGLLRVRSFTQDDGHVFCHEEQIEQEVVQMIRQSFEVYRDFGFGQIAVKLALRPEHRIGSDAIWDKAEAKLAEALESQGVAYDLLPEEGAFYGPKIEFHLYDAIGRSWQCGTIQVDFSMPERLGATYIDANSQKQTPVMIHRAIVGSLERFIGMLIEHYAGKLPVWLAPTQVAVLGISNKQDEYLRQVCEKLQKNGIRAKLDLRNEKIGFKIREHTLSKIPFFVIAGEKEQQENVVTIRKRTGQDLGAMPVASFIELLNQVNQQKITLENMED